MRLLPLLSAFFLIISACQRSPHTTSTLFEAVGPEQTGIDFANMLVDTEQLNVFAYRNYVNGGGVGIGDVNGDGLADLYVTANELPNKLYLNQGNFQFRDASEEAGIAGTRGWSTGVSLVDINGDGWLDVYVCNAGNVEDEARANELYVNQGVDKDGMPRFVEAARRYGLADEGYSTHASFFDFDGDGDLDVYVVNNSIRPAGSFGLRNIRSVRDKKGGDKLYRNDSGHFLDVSEAAGIYGSEIGFGLGATVGDINADGLLDIYVSNDFFERDYLYVNNGDGTFRESLEERMPHISLSSMGADAADINNDGFPEIYVTDMLPESDRRLKTTTIYRTWGIYQSQLRNDYYHQFMRNVLHLNNRDGTFSDIGQIAGVSRTDWSWGALFADFDSDGYKDIFVSNGIYKDLTNQDFIEYLGSEATLRQFAESDDRSFLALLEKIPSEPISNYAFRNLGDLRFKNVAAEWGLDTPSFSNGAAYGDLDNDGDLDIVVNNVNTPLFVYRNRLEQMSPSSYLQFQLVGTGLNTIGVGAAVRVFRGDQVFYVEQVPQRGFQSSVDPILTVGLGGGGVADSVVVRWPDGAVQVLRNVEVNKRLRVLRTDAEIVGVPTERMRTPPMLEAADEATLPYRHVENEFVDFDREPLLPWMNSREGPGVAVGDVNGDGREDIFLGGAKGYPGSMFLQSRAGRFEPLAVDALDADAESEDIGAALFDADGDGDLDLYVVSGGSEYSPGDPALADRLYINDGSGVMTRSNDQPAGFESGSVVAPADYDDDGDIDLFVGGRLVPSRYGLDPTSRILRNEGDGRFVNVTNFVAPDIDRVGLVTDAVWLDYNGDGHPDLAIAGEWMPVTLFSNDGKGRLRDATVQAQLDKTNGLWRSLVAVDADNDGDTDLIAGNLGLNTKLRADAEQPLTLYVSDFDQNGSIEQVLFNFEGSESYPVALRGELLKQLPFLAGKYPTHERYAEQTAEDIFSQDELAKAVKREVFTLESSVFVNLGDGTFRREALPFEAQLSPVLAIHSDDLTGDGAVDLLVAGNLLPVQPSLGRMDASRGVLLAGSSGETRFRALPSEASGFRVHGQVRHIVSVHGSGREHLLIAIRNDDTAELFRPRRVLAQAAH